MSKPALLVDETHLGRHVTGLERITLELFSTQALAPLPVIPIRSTGTLGMIRAQTLSLPARLLGNPRALALCPGFPPSIPLSLFGERVIPYIHDSFLISRPGDLNWRARTYMAPAFRFALRRLPWLLVNSETTGADIARHAHPGAKITLYRPHVRDVFGIADQSAMQRPWRRKEPLRLIAIGTVEPRKNLRAAAAIIAALAIRGIDAHLDIVGRFGWGEDLDALRALPGVTLHGYQAPDTVKSLIAAAHALITTSHDEGLGLTPLEVQHGGLAVIASDLAVFHEALGSSALFIDPADAAAAATAIERYFLDPDAASRGIATAANLRRWNENADRDRFELIDRLQAKLAARS